MTTHSIIGTIQHPVKTQWQSQIYTLRSISRRRQWHPTPVLLPGKSMDRETWWAAVHGVMKSRARLSDFTFTFHFHALEKEMATDSSVLAWRIPGTGEPGGLPSVGSHSWTRLKWLSSSSFCNTFIVWITPWSIWKESSEKYPQALNLKSFLR